MKGMIKDALILFAITLVAGILLGAVNEITKGPIAEAQNKAKMEACQTVFPQAALFEKAQVNPEAVQKLTEMGMSEVTIEEISYATDENGNRLGVVIIVTDHEGYGGDIQFSMGITTDGILNGISLLSISETPGLGMEADDLLVPQFAQVPVTTFTYTKNGSKNSAEIDAISGATVTTKAVVNGVNAGVAYYEMLLEGGELNE